MMATRRLFHGRGRPRGSLRLLAATAAPLALAGAALGPSASATTAQPAAGTAAVHTTRSSASTLAPATSGQGQQLLSLPGLDGSSHTVTLITGDQVRLTRASSGRYSATAIPGTGPATQIDFQAQGTRRRLTSLLATPDDAAALISSGQVDPGLFDLDWLTKHHDTGPSAKIPVTVQYAEAGNDATLRSDAARLPGATVTGTTPASGKVTLTVAARKAAAFWTTLTGRSAGAATSAASTPPASLTQSVSRIWLTGHQVSTNPGAQSQDEQPQDSQPLYTVTETITRSTGPVDYRCEGYASLVANFCLTIPAPTLLGVAGAGQGTNYHPSKPRGTCVNETPATPAPVCTAWQLTYTVPSGVYFAHAQGEFLTTDDAEGTLEQANMTLDVPQFIVTGNTAISLDADNAVPVTVNTPQPGVPYGPDEMQVSRLLPDGTYFSSVFEDLLTQGVSNWWAVPTPPGDQATVGSYHYSPALSLGAPEVTASVTAPTHLTVHPLYPCDSVTNGFSGCNVTRFAGRQSLQLVNAGYGTSSDFSTIDAHGKLALITIVPACTVPGLAGCTAPDAVLPAQLANAQQAGAAGVIINAGTDKLGYPDDLPAQVSLNENAGPLVDIPFAEIDATEGNALLGLLAKGPVNITVSDSGETPYAYFLRFDQEGQIPASLHYTPSTGQLAEISSSYHDPTPPQGGIQVYGDTYRLDDNFGVADGLDFPGPRNMRDYYGPVSPSLTWELDTNNPWTGPNSNLTIEYKILDQPSTDTLDWSEPPTTLGSASPGTEADLYQASQGGASYYCAGCRQGDTFWPVFGLVSGGNPDPSTATGFAPGNIQLYNQAGQEIAATQVDGLATYQLPAQQARYKLVAPYDNTTTTWNFTSAEPTRDQTPPGTYCLGSVEGVSTATCQADPLVFLRYQAGLSLTNTITPGTHQLQVSGYHQDLNAPPVTSLKLWTSTDDGTSWQPAKISGGKGGSFTATYTIPADATDVSIKAQANDAAGNDINQEIDNAYPVATGATAPTSTEVGTPR